MSADGRAWTVVCAVRHLGDPYMWGGDGDGENEWGYDCSGLVCRVLGNVARSGWSTLYDGQRRTAQGLYDYYTAKRLATVIREAKSLQPGSLLFYRKPGAPFHHVAIHVALLPAGTPVAVEAGGAGSGATTLRAALRASACVRLTDSDYHGEGVEWVAVDPWTATA